MKQNFGKKLILNALPPLLFPDMCVHHRESTREWENEPYPNTTRKGWRVHTYRCPTKYTALHWIHTKWLIKMVQTLLKPKLLRALNKITKINYAKCILAVTLSDDWRSFVLIFSDVCISAGQLHIAKVCPSALSGRQSSNHDSGRSLVLCPKKGI
jgi:hypothetical protein